MSKKTKQFNDDLNELFEQPELSVVGEIDSKLEANTEQKVDEPVTLEEIVEVLKVDEPEEKKKRGRKRKQEKEKTVVDDNQILVASTAFAIIGISKSIATLVGRKWEITEKAEADFLAKSTIEFLDYIYPDWKKSSPIVNFTLAWSSYFVQRVFKKENEESET